MKKSILFAMFIAGVFAANAQTTTSSPGQPTATATLNVKLYPIQTIIVNASQNIIDLEYKTVDNYLNGVKSDNADHLTIYSTGGFEVMVNSSGLKSGTDILTSDVKLTSSVGARAIAGATYKSNVPLITTPSLLLESANGGFDRTVTVSYQGANNYMNQYTNTPGVTPAAVKTYTTEVTYTIAAK